MKLNVVCIRDRAADCFLRPGYELSTGAAIRSFGDEVNRVAADNMLYLHPEDFDLYLLGTFYDNGKFELLEVPRQLAVGKDLVRVSAPQS